MKVSVDTKIPNQYDKGRLTDIFREIQTAINGIAEEGIVYFYRAGTAAPTTGSWKQGDFLRNSTPTELGSASSKYTIAGWRCVASGTPGTWVQVRDLTGN